MVERNKYTDQILRYAGEREPGIDANAPVLSFTALPWSEELMERVLQFLAAADFAEVRSLSSDKPASTTGCREDLNLLEVIDRYGNVRWIVVNDSDELWQDPEVLVVV